MSIAVLGIETMRRELREFAAAAQHLDLVSARIELRTGDKASLAAGVKEIEHAIDAESRRFSKSAEMRLIWKELRATRVMMLTKRFKKLAEAKLNQDIDMTAASIVRLDLTDRCGAR